MPRLNGSDFERGQYYKNSQPNNAHTMLLKMSMFNLLLIPLFKVDEVDLEAFQGVSPSGVQDIPKPGEGGLCRSQHIAVPRVQLRHPRNKLSSRPASLPAERVAGRGQIDENNTRNSADQDDRKGAGCDQSIEEVDETESTKSRAGTHYRRTFIDTQTLRRTWDKQYKHDVAARTVRIVASSPSESTAVDASDVSASVPVSSSSFTLGTTASISTIFPNRPYTVAVRPSRILRREDNLTKYNTVATGFRAPRTLQPPPGTFYKPPSGSKAKELHSCPSANSAEEEDEEEEGDDDDEEEEEEGIEIEVSVDEPLEEDDEADQAAMSQSPSSSLEELSPDQAKPVYQRLRPRRLQEVERREAHFV